MENPYADVARIFHRMRLFRSWSCADLAEKAGLPLATIEEYEAEPGRMTSRTANRVLDVMPFDPVDGPMFDPPLPPGFPPREPKVLLAEMEARVHEWEAALRIDERRFREALTCLEKALVLHPWPERVGRVLLSKAAVLGELDRERQALETLSQAEPYFDPLREPELWLRLRLETLYFLCHAKRFPEAVPLLAETLALASRVGSERQRLLARWMEGWVAAGEGEEARALDLLSPVRAAFLEAGSPFEAAAIGLELAALWAARDDRAALERLAAELEPLTQKKSFPQASRSVLKLFCSAVHRGRCTPELCRRLADELRRSGCRLLRPYALPV